ncbi:hypothetical protein FKW77_003808 [Venturia effusa]|uniref:Aldehyde dehydrogenase domain-containing protein n=1 Tax=Venturia effusa TaxID=50376 RepID=A0A517LF76_9PEZI|nr:hypothetical protein FKW77_003808 [Venturia effusa]
MAHEGTLPKVKRFVTTHNQEGKAIFSSKFEEELPSDVLPGDSGAAFLLGYTTNTFPVNLNGDADLKTYEGYIENAPGITISTGTVLRYVDMAPGLLSPMHRTSQPFSRIRAAAVDGRLANVFERQNQLKRLHAGLVKGADSIQEAIVKDTGNTKAEAAVEFSLTLSILKKQLASLNPEKELEKEYRIAKGVDAADRREAIGIAYIEPAKHTFFYSVVVPLSVAITAGNCVIVHLENSLKDLPSLLQRTLLSSLDADIFAVANSKPTDTAFLASCIQVLQEGSKEETNPLKVLSPPTASVLAIVDRTANLEEAAEALLIARFGFNGTSPYAPDVVLVNEFVKKAFLNAVIRKSIDFMTGRHGNGVANEKSSNSRRTQTTEDLSSKKGVNVITSGSNGTIAEISDRNSEIFAQKQTGTSLLIHSVRSLDDAIDLANKNGTLLASYIFASPSAGKYLSQFVHAHTTFVNNIPVELLVGPAAPLGSPVSASSRYSMEQFTQPRATYTQQTAESNTLAKLIVSGDFSLIEQVTRSATAALPVGKGRPEKAAPFGFFEQGILTGLGMALSSIVLGGEMLDETSRVDQKEGFSFWEGRSYWLSLASMKEADG